MKAALSSQDPAFLPVNRRKYSVAAAFVLGCIAVFAGGCATAPPRPAPVAYTRAFSSPNYLYVNREYAYFPQRYSVRPSFARVHHGGGHCGGHHR
jgi:hypothetical protein